METCLGPVSISSYSLIGAILERGAFAYSLTGTLKRLPNKRLTLVIALRRQATNPVSPKLH